MNDWEDFFDRHKEYVVTVRFYECDRSFSLEQLYQAFKARLEDERSADQPSGDVCQK